MRGDSHTEKNKNKWGGGVWSLYIFFFCFSFFFLGEIKLKKLEGKVSAELY
jgi:hypothetical protein